MYEQKFFKCSICGNLVSFINNSGVPMICCGEEMQELLPNTVEASAEKHIPEVSVNGRLVHVKIGSEPHPMTAEHHIQFIYLQTENGGQMQCLKIDAKAHAMFAVLEQKPLNAYAYCNLHGLWKMEIPQECECDDACEENNSADETICSAEFAEGCI